MKMTARVLIPAILLLASGVAEGNTRTVKTVHAGDLIEFEEGWTTHLCGVDVPDPKTTVGREAFDFTKRQLEGKLVALFTWTTDNTAAGIVYAEDGLPFAKIMYGKDMLIDIAALLLEKGYARIDAKNLPEDCEHYRAIEAEARGKRLGIWAKVD